MNKVINVCLLVITILSCSLVNAARKVSVEITTSAMVNVSLTDVKKGEKLVFKDIYGEILYNVVLEASPSYETNFNLDNVPDGMYFVESESAYEVKITPILKNLESVSLLKQSSVTLFKPQVSVEGKIVKVLLNNISDYPVSVIIYDTNGSILEEIIGSKEDVFKRTFDFSEVSRGNYHIYFRVEDRSFVSKITI